MSSLLNTNWTFDATNNDFTTFTTSFAANGVANVTFSTGMGAQGTWSEGPNFRSFVLSFTPNGNEWFAISGRHTGGQGSGTAHIEWTGGVQISPFTMVKQ